MFRKLLELSSTDKQQDKLKLITEKKRSKYSHPFALPVIFEITRSIKGTEVKIPEAHLPVTRLVFVKEAVMNCDPKIYGGNTRKNKKKPQHLLEYI